MHIISSHTLGQGILEAPDYGVCFHLHWAVPVEEWEAHKVGHCPLYPYRSATAAALFREAFGAVPGESADEVLIQICVNLKLPHIEVRRVLANRLLAAPDRRIVIPTKT